MKTKRLLALWPAAIVVLGAIVVLIALGLWQVARLNEKLAIVTQIEARAKLAPQSLPPRAQWSGLKADAYEYTVVTAEGVFDHPHEALIFRPDGAIAGREPGPGFEVVTPLKLVGGGTVLVSRGFTPDDHRNPATRAAGQIEGRTTVTGLMRGPEPRNAFTPTDDPVRNQWFTRDPAAISASIGIADAAPFSIDADATPNPGGLPKGGATVIDIPNNHLAYALTWFGLAGALAGVFGVYVASRVRAR